MNDYINLVSIPQKDFEEMRRDPYLFKDWKEGYSKEKYSRIDTDNWEDIERFIIGYSPHPHTYMFKDDIICKIFGSGVLLGEDLDGGYSDWHYAYLTPNEVSKLSAKLANITDKYLREIFNADSMECSNSFPLLENDEVDAQEVFDYIKQEYEKVKEFYRLAAEKGEAVISYR